jgi:hypothetical protein
VIDEGNTIIAGNETANACAAEGYKEVVIVDLEPGQILAARRSDWSETEKTGYAIADNQTATTAEWVPELPDAIRSLELDGFELDALGFSDKELKAYLGEAKIQPTGEGDWPAMAAPTSHTVVVRYDDADIPAILAFIGETDAVVLGAGKAGEKVIERIREVFANRKNRKR